MIYVVGPMNKEQRTKNKERGSDAGSLFVFCFLFFVPCLLLAACTCTPRPPAPDQGPPVVVVDPDEESLTPATPETEPNDTQQRAQPLAQGEWIEAKMAAKDADWFRFTIKQDGQVARVQVRGVTGLDLALEAYNNQGKRLVKVDNAREGGGEVLVNLSVEPGAYLLRVSEVKGRPGTLPYRVGFSLRAREEGEEVEPNWKAAMATPLAPDQEAVGYLGWRTDNDWYQVDVSSISPSARLRVELDGVDGVRANLSVRTADGKILAERWTGTGDGAVLANLVPPEASQGPLMVVVRCREQTNVETRYYLRVMSAVPAGLTEQEPNDTPDQATTLLTGQALAGLLLDRYDRDLYRIPAEEVRWVSLKVRPPMGLDLELALLDSAGKPVWTVNAAGVRLPEEMPALLVAPPGAVVRVRAVTLDQVSGQSPYVISARTMPGAGLEAEPNDTPALASDARAAGRWPIRGFIHPGEDKDHFKLLAESSRLRLVARSPGGAGMRLSLLDLAGRSLASVTAERGGEEIVLEADVTGGQEYLLELLDPAGKGQVDEAYTIVRENP